MSLLGAVKRAFGWGVSANDLATLEAANGGPVDFVRIYGWVGQIPKGVEALASTRRIIVSMKFRDATGAVIPAADVAGKHAADVAAFIAWFNALPVCPAGPHILTPEHEIDAKSAAASGSTAALNAAFDYCVKQARTSAGWAGLIACCVTGFDPTHREILYAVDFTESDVICIDQPYNGQTLPFASGDSIAGPAVDYFTATYPGKPIIITEWGSNADTTGGTARADWIEEFGRALTTPRYAAVVAATYWNDGGCALSTPADRAAWAAAGALAKTPQMVAVPVAALNVLAGAMAAMAASKAAMSTAQTALVAAQADYAVKSSAAIAAVAAVTG